ncbi:MAG: hypothetical protein AB4063_00510 [Crocosphaera sp.]
MIISKIYDLHIAATLLMKSEEFITTEKADKSIHRTNSVKIISIYAISSSG